LLALPSTKEFINELAKNDTIFADNSVGNDLNSRLSAILKTVRGRTGGTFAHWQIGLAYAETVEKP
jgi:hypothetical protein